MSLSADNISDYNRERANKILEVVMAYAQLDFTKKTEIAGDDDVLDAISAGINMLGEELQSSTVSLKEKEQLLKEVHHRVKNNLQIVSSLLNLQSDNILDRRFLEMIKDSRNRINSMAIVHEMLYASKDLSKIAISEYIQRLCFSIDQSFSRPGSGIKFELTIEKDLFFDIDFMIPIGLIVNEIVSNSFKYAFPENKGNILISLVRHENNYELDVRDDGIGLPAGFDKEKDGHLGMQLITMLSEQMEAKINMKQQEGTSYHITFKV